MRIVDLHHYRTGPWQGVIYCGRAMPYPSVPEIARVRSPLANPFTPRKHGDKAMPLFRAWLWERIERADPVVMAALAGIDGESVLACWCCSLQGEAIFTEPEVCHCQIIAKAVRFLNEGAGK